MSRAFVTLVCLAMLSAGCARPVDTAILAANVASVSLGAVGELLAERYRAEQLAAVGRVGGDPGLDSVKAERRDRAEAVRAKYRPLWLAYGVARAAWLSLAQSIRSAQAVERAGATPAELELVLLTRALARAQTDLILAAAHRGLKL